MTGRPVRFVGASKAGRALPMFLAIVPTLWHTADTASAANIEPTIGAGVALGFDSWVALAAPLANGEDPFGSGAADEMPAWSSCGAPTMAAGASTATIIAANRPGVIGAPALDGGRFGTGLDFGGRRLVVGHPHAGNAIPGGGRRGPVWLYGVDDIFTDGFQ